MKGDYATNSHHLTHTFLFRKVGRMYFLNLGVKGLKSCFEPGQALWLVWSHNCAVCWPKGREKELWPFHSQEWSMSNFSCSLTRNITSHSMKNLAVHSLPSWQMIILPILTTSLILFSFEGLGECTFRTWEWKGSWINLIGLWKTGPTDQNYLDRWLVNNCHGQNSCYKFSRSFSDINTCHVEGRYSVAYV